MTKVSGWLATWAVEGYVIQELKMGSEILVTASTFEELVGTKIFMINGNITKKEEVSEDVEVAATKEIG